jgi:hypothetical protein
VWTIAFGYGSIVFNSIVFPTLPLVSFMHSCGLPPPSWQEQSWLDELPLLQPWASIQGWKSAECSHVWPVASQSSAMDIQLSLSLPSVGDSCLTCHMSSQFLFPRNALDLHVPHPYITCACQFCWLQGPITKFPTSLFPWAMWNVDLDRCLRSNKGVVGLNNCTLVVETSNMDYISHWWVVDYTSANTCAACALGMDG